MPNAQRGTLVCKRRMLCAVISWRESRMRESRLSGSGSGEGKRGVTATAPFLDFIRIQPVHERRSTGWIRPQPVAPF